MPNPRELSQFGSFVEVNDTNKNIGIATTGTPFVGIGTLSPEEKLHVVGNLRVDGDINISGVGTFSELDTVSKIGINSGGTQVGVVTTLNFIGAGNTFLYNASTNTIDISIQSGSSNVSVDTFGAIGDFFTDDTTAIQATLDFLESRGGGLAQLESGKRYRITSRISIGSSCGIVGDGTPSLYAVASGFDNNDTANWFTTPPADNAVVLDLTIAKTYNQTLRGFKIESEQQDGRKLIVINARNCQDLTVENLEIFNFPMCYVMVLDSVVGSSHIRGNYVHDCTDSVNEGQHAVINIDDNRVNDVSSSNIHITNNTFKNHTVKLDSRGAMESDGITISGAYSSSAGVSSSIIVTNNIIDNVGEGIDTYGHHGIISDNVIKNTHNFGLKIIHGASYNVFQGNTIFNTGIAGIVLGQSDVSGVGNTKENIIDGNIVTNVDYKSQWNTTQRTACIKMDANDQKPFVPTDTLVTNNILNPGQYGQWAILNQVDCVRTVLMNNRMINQGQFSDGDGQKGFIKNDRTDSVIVNYGIGTTNPSYIQTNNNLGIGSTAPISELDVSGGYTLNNTTVENFGLAIKKRSATGRFTLGQDTVRVGVAVSTITVGARSGDIVVNVGDYSLNPLTVN